MNTDLILQNYLKQVEINKPVQTVKPKFTPEQLFTAWEVTGKMKLEKFEMDNTSISIIDFCFNPKYTSKGGIIMGNKGVGKTLNMDIFATINTNMLKVNTECYEVGEIERQYRIKGAVFLEHLEDLPCLVINDMGIEQDLNDFGTLRNVIADIMYLRYRKFQKNRYKTYCTTNLKWDKIQAKYGERLSDRFKEMFNRIEILGESKR
jgi:DNA replication protein DnaC